ncbi:GntR family transcriptional regulator [Gimibacter soli]|uniref:GntR family transcriptional regulator n=1 Tax=Gimibacter soli TaxID=3024400 RepID=A0AAE9XSI8_9PROT|nr:GntR family transcriptional regulator [Gimibacter soli]WCL53255.1 GntR family transcriptional regulator [Gimibacter soli]
MSKATEKAYETIRAAILSGRYAPGAHLKEEELVGLCGVSRTPVRDALRRLAADRYVVARRNQGTYVNEWSLDDIACIFEMRALLEGYAAERAATRITPDQLARVDKAWRDIEDVLAKDKLDIPEFLRANRVFHTTIIEAACNRQLRETIDQLVQPPIVNRTAMTYSRQDLRQSNDHHGLILSALKTGDAVTACTAMRQHLLTSYQNFLRNYDRSLGQE